MLRGGQQLRPIVEWRVDQEIREQYVIQVHLIDAQGHVWAVDDREPDNGLSPTDQWTTGRRSVYQHILSLPPTMPEGDYQIAIGVHNPRTGLNLSARDMTGQLIDDDPVIATVHIKERQIKHNCQSTANRTAPVRRHARNAFPRLCASA